MSESMTWHELLQKEKQKPSYSQLQEFLAEERKTKQIFPREDDVFRAFEATPFDRVKVVLLGQDPYHGDGQAHGLAFSVQPGIKAPPSLANIFKELRNDLGINSPGHGCLKEWADRGVLLLNTVLTVRAQEPGSHRGKGWEAITDAAIIALAQRAQPLVFLLWGAQAQKKGQLLDMKRHRILASAHPSPLSAKEFFGSRPFSQANKALTEWGMRPIDWQLSSLQ
jgi:uracil-DNA glycosylase